MRVVFTAGMASVLLMGTAAARADDYCPECHQYQHTQAVHGHCHHCHHHDGLFARGRSAIERGKQRFREAKQRFMDDYHQANYWPDPYRCEARYSAMAPFDVQMDNAWADMTNVSAFYFDPDTHELTHAGRLHVQWVLRQAPLARRSLTVQPGDLPSITESRLASVRKAVTELAGENNQIAIAVSDRVPYLTPGIDVDVSSRLFYSSFPLPRLPGTTTEQSGAAAPSGLPGGP